MIRLAQGAMLSRRLRNDSGPCYRTAKAWERPGPESLLGPLPSSIEITRAAVEGRKPQGVGTSHAFAVR